MIESPTPLARLIALAQEVYDSHRSKDGSDSDWKFDAKTKRYVADEKCDWCIDFEKAMAELRASASTPPTNKMDIPHISDEIISIPSKATGHKVIRCPFCKEFGSHLKDCSLGEQK